MLNIARHCPPVLAIYHEPFGYSLQAVNFGQLIIDNTFDGKNKTPANGC